MHRFFILCILTENCKLQIRIIDFVNFAMFYSNLIGINVMVYRHLVLFLIFLFLRISVCFSQSESIKRSNNKVSLGGKEYYIHIVRKGETLSAIANAYNIAIDSIKVDNRQISDSLKLNQYLKIRITGTLAPNTGFIYHKVAQGDTPFNLAKRYHVTVDEIYKLNPGSELGIKKDDILKFPLNQSIEKTDEYQNKNQEPDALALNDEKVTFIEHKVKKQETIYGIARQYKITPQEIEKYNPDIVNQPIQPDKILKIPVSKQSEVKESDYQFHKVIKKETIYSIARLYKISGNEIYNLNPDLKNRELIEGELIKVPVQPVGNLTETNQSENKELTRTRIQDKTAHSKPDTLDTKGCNDRRIDVSKVYKIAFFLPLYLNVNDTLGKYNDILRKDEYGNDIVTNEPKQGVIEDKIYPKSRNFIEFYTGAMLALEDLKKMGISFDVEIFDTRGDSLYLVNLLKSRHLEKFNLFIGPVFSDEISVVSDYAWEHQINIVSPLSVKSSFIEHNPYAFQVSPSHEIQMKYAAEFLNESDVKNYIVVHDGNAKEQDYMSEFKRQLFSAISSENLDQIKYTEYYYFDASDSLLRNTFTPGIENIVIVPSSDRAFVTDLMGKLNGYSYEFNITVLGQPRWERFESIELDNFHNTNTHLFSNSYVDYTKPSVVQFVNDYRILFKTEPDRFAFQGYDITTYFCLALNKYGHDFRNCLHFFKTPLLQTDFNFVPYTDQGGFQNTAIYVLNFAPDYTLQKVASYPLGK